MRILKEAVLELKEIDPQTSVTEYFIRQLALQGKILSIRAGRKRLINFDSLLEYLSQSHETEETHGIRKQT